MLWKRCVFNFLRNSIQYCKILCIIDCVLCIYIPVIMVFHYKMVFYCIRRHIQYIMLLPSQLAKLNQRSSHNCLKLLLMIVYHLVLLFLKNKKANGNQSFAADKSHIIHGADDFDDFDMEDSTQNTEDQDDDFMDDGFAESQGSEATETHGHGV